VWGSGGKTKQNEFLNLALHRGEGIPVIIEYKGGWTSLFRHGGKEKYSVNTGNPKLLVAQS